MTKGGLDESRLDLIRKQLKALSNRYAVEILQVLNPDAGEVIQSMGWDEIVEGMLHLKGIDKPPERRSKEKTQKEVKYESERKSLVSGGTIYESMTKMVKAGFVTAIGKRGKKNRQFVITHDGRLALAALTGMIGPTREDTEIQQTAKLLLRHKNFIRLLPAQDLFLREIEDFSRNLVIQMPPGSGKTFLAMILILISLQKGKRSFYLSPYTSLNGQVIDEYKDIFEDLEFSMVRQDGQSRATEEQLDSADIIVATYESFASAFHERKSWTNEIGLLVIDELTELDSPREHAQAAFLGTDRSVNLDYLIALLKPTAQIITLSSRFGETDEIAEWLDADVFRPSVRLRPDEFIVTHDDDVVYIHSSDGTQSSTLESDNMLRAVIDHLGDYDKKSVLIVAGSRNDAEYYTRRLAESHPREISEKLVSQIIGEVADMPVAQRLKKVLEKGIAFHHSGLHESIRDKLEENIKKKTVRTVVSTTGITSGMSFPFDCVIILFGSSMYYLEARSRYMQVAGRIGEYHLAEHGGRVYIIFESPTRSFENAEQMEEQLLHRPLEPLRPGELYPSLMANLMTRSPINKTEFQKRKLEEELVEIASRTLRCKTVEGCVDRIKRMFSILFDWFVKNGAFVEITEGYKISESAKHAVQSGFDLIQYVKIRDVLQAMDNPKEDELVQLILRFRLPQAMRPRSLIPTDIELEAMDLDPPEEWYINLAKGRAIVKQKVLEHWIRENPVADVLTLAKDTAKNLQVRGMNIDDGDLGTLVAFCSETANDLSSFFKEMGKDNLAERLHILSRQFRFGVKEDIARTDMLELIIPENETSISRRLSREEVRTLYENGYHSISEIVRKDIDPSKRGLARDRFAKNSGFETDFAKEIYKAALSHVRAQMDRDD
ncbi:MAG: DEAD/DEAH box helicase [Candidatus Lokiarchaeota archaeon]|nr:DEAD/DEAH box helicase [Candidatus Lokiarchaeota archaeon]